MTKIKICGLTRPEDIGFVNEYQPDYIGFVFAKSKRQIDYQTARKLKALLNPGILVVGVFVDEDMEKIVSIVEEGIIDIMQLHGCESEAYIQTLRQRTNAKIIKAVKVTTLQSNSIKTKADYILLDSTAGSGKLFDWKRKIDCNKPIFLAGGLNPENVAEAVNQMRPYAVDVSSGVETEGKKDRDKIKKFIEESRQ